MTQQTPQRKWKQGKAVLSDGRECTIQEVTGGTLHRMRANKDDPLASMAIWVQDCTLDIAGEKPTEEAVDALTIFDFTHLMKAIRVLSYGPELDAFEFVCASSGHKLPVKFRPQVNVANLEEVPPDYDQRVKKHRWGTVELRPQTWAMMRSVDDAGIDSVFLLRVQSVDEKPFRGLGSLSGTEIRDVKRQMDLYDGKEGMELAVACPTCRTVHAINVMTHQEALLDFFGSL